MNDPDKKKDNRWMHRPVMEWSRAEKRNESGTVENRIFYAIKRLVEVRKNSDEFSDNAYFSVFYTGNEHVFSFSRTIYNREVIVICNFDEVPHRIPADHIYFQQPYSFLIDLYTQKKADMSTGYIEIPAYGFLWLKAIPALVSTERS